MVTTLIFHEQLADFCETVVMGKKRRRTDEDTEFDLTRKAKEVKDDNEKRLIVVLENAQLETVKVIFSLPFTVIRIPNCPNHFSGWKNF